MPSGCGPEFLRSVRWGKPASSIAFVLRRARTSLVVLGVYCLPVSLVYFGLPLLSHPGRYLVGTGGESDPEIFVWSFAWWPHAIASWTNPFFTHSIYHPQGCTKPLTWATTVPWPRPRLLADHSPFRAGAVSRLQRRRSAAARAASPPGRAFLLCPCPNALGLGVARRRLPLRLLELHDRSSVLRASGPDRGLPGPADCPRPRPLSERRARRAGARLAPWRADRRPDLDLERGHADPDDRCSASASCSRSRSRDRTRVSATPAPVVARAGRRRATRSARSSSRPLVYYTLTGLVSQSFANPPLFSGDLLNFVLPTRLIAWGGSSVALLPRPGRPLPRERQRAELLSRASGAARGRSIRTSRAALGRRPLPSPRSPSSSC